MSLDPINEVELQEWVRKAQDGDGAAFEKIYDHFFLPIYRYTAFRVSGDAAEDLVADVFVKAWEKLSRYKARKGVPFGAWLFRIARHTVIDAYRRNREYEEMPEDYADPDALNRADARVQDDDRLRIVRKAMDALPKRYREILVLTYVAELPTNEVARVLRLTEGAVRILKFRALRKLEAALPPEMGN